MKKDTMRGGFTLIELLVVIMIIAILAAILFPVFMHVKKQSYRSGCINNMRQLAGAVKLYEQNSNGVLFCYWYPYGSTDAEPLIKAYERYVGSVNAFFCPADREFGRHLERSDPHYGPNGMSACSYAYTGGSGDKGRDLGLECARPEAKSQASWVFSDIRYMVVGKASKKLRFSFPEYKAQDTATSHARVLWDGPVTRQYMYIPGLHCTRLYPDCHVRYCKGWQRTARDYYGVQDMP